MNTIVSIKVWDGQAKEWRVIDVDVHIDIPQVANILGTKALRNKSRKAREMGSAIVVSLRS